MKLREYLNENRTNKKNRMTIGGEMIYEIFKASEPSSIWEKTQTYITNMQFFKDRLQNNINDLKQKGLLG